MNKALVYEKVFAATVICVNHSGTMAEKCSDYACTCTSVAKDVVLSGFEELVDKPLTSALLGNLRDFQFNSLLFLFSKTKINLTFCAPKSKS